MNELKREYNEYLTRVNNAINYFEKTDVEKAMKWVDDYNKLVAECGKILIKLKQKGYSATIHETLNGFKLD